VPADAAAPRVLALDFDGVVCDGRPEYFEAGWRAYRAAWPGARADAARTPALASRFGALRPLIESGWEFPVLIHALLAGEDERAFGDRAAWLEAGRRLVASAGVTADALGQALNRARDAWFARDPGDWVRHHAFYPGVPALLARAASGGVRVVVVTTKAERFARALLESVSPRLGDLPIVGREPGRAVPKHESLTRLATEHALALGDGLWFVEDLFETLEDVAARPALARVRLFLASWGYNVLEQRARASLHPRVGVISLADVARPLADWPVASGARGGLRGPVEAP
jgi:phosphoglycolate phosphatase-like HAD superfamily hydrolase